jgi:hypothetical protein
MNTHDLWLLVDLIERGAADGAGVPLGYGASRRRLERAGLIEVHPNANPELVRATAEGVRAAGVCVSVLEALSRRVP